MRSDMHKVIVERPRKGGGYGSAMKGRRIPNKERQDPESAPTKAPLHDRHTRSKVLNENLAPLIRYLRKQVGRPWDKVRSEIGQVISSRDSVQKHVLDHVKDFVFENVQMIDGVPCEAGQDGFKPITRHRRHLPMFVHPKTGLLLLTKKPNPKADRKRAPLIRRIDRNTCAVYIDGCWQEAKMKLCLAPYGVTPPQDVVIGRLWTSTYWDSAALLKAYGPSGGGPGGTQYAASLRPLRRAEIKMLPFDAAALFREAKSQ